MFWRILKTGGIGRHYYTFEIDAWAMTLDYNAKFLCCGNDELLQSFAESHKSVRELLKRWKSL